MVNSVEPVSCPCLSGESYRNCCGVFHRGEAAAPTAVRLMRSRYSAFAVGDVDYLLATWHPQSRPTFLELEPALRWYRLDILGSERGGMLDSKGTVEFRAWYTLDGVSGDQHEVSQFLREDGRWLYVQPA
ncbi:MAG TPA: YchJ family metal-binding protein [Glaciibacter sp.]|nr:YchJ family metal-binding protein [Glaciibacter sp.]